MISIIINSVDDARFAAVEAMYEQLLAGEPHEIIRIADARSMCEGYNRGIDQSRGELLVFGHDDIEILQPSFAERLKRHLEEFDVIGVAGTTRVAAPFWAASGPPFVYGQIAQTDSKTGGWDVFVWSNAARSIGNMQALDGVFLACRRSVFQTVRFDNAYDRFHLYDLDFTYAAHRAGLKLGVCCDLNLVHASMGDGEHPTWRQSAGLFMHKWGATLPSAARDRTWYPMRIRCKTREEIVEAMTPPHWDFTS